MPRRDDIKRILVLGSGPIVIGQAAEFDYSGAQACKALLADGFEVILINSNPATIMTDPDFATRTYIEPLLPEVVKQVIRAERPDVLLPTLGGQTALNLAKSLYEDGTLAEFGVELIGANYETIQRAEDREVFDQTMQAAGLKTVRNVIITSVSEATAALDTIGLPAIIRPAFTLGGQGGGVAHTLEEFTQIVRRGLRKSPIGQVLIDQSVLGWGEFELEVMRDSNDNVVIVCSIENIDPMGVHTGDSVTVAPQQTLTDRTYQKLRDQAIAVLRAVGVETGGSNVQFAVNYDTDEIVVIEMNPRVSRSSALASKATGFPIAKIAAQLAVGYTLDELSNDMTKTTPASFEPALDYVVVKWPRFAFEKFPGANRELTTHMKSVGEAMSIERTFPRAFAKAMRSRELDKPFSAEGVATAELLDSIATPTAERFDAIVELIRRGVSVEKITEKTKIHRWFVEGIAESVTTDPTDDRYVRTFKSVDTCAAEFEAITPYFYSAAERPDRDGNPRHEVPTSDRQKIMILGSGPNRIGQGIEFDYCCVHAAMTVRETGREAIMVNCNPETVSTDYDTSDRLYFEPLTFDDVMGIIDLEQPDGVIVQFGGQTPLRLAKKLLAAGVNLIGTTPESIDLAEDRGRFSALLETLKLKAPPYATASSREEALEKAQDVGFPLLVRPSYVLGGRAMEIVDSVAALADYIDRVEPAMQGGQFFLDRFLQNAIEIDVDAVSDGEDVWIGGIMEHVEHAGIHSGDSACVLPPYSLSKDLQDQIREATKGLALSLSVIGPLNVQFAVSDGHVYVIEANPRASRTVPFVSKATGVSLAKVACRVMLGESLENLDLPEMPIDAHVSVKEAVLPFDRFRGADPRRGPEMRSTGEVMGVGRNFTIAFAKAQAAAGHRLPKQGAVFISVRDEDKPAVESLAKGLLGLGFKLFATEGTAKALAAQSLSVEALPKIGEGSPDVVDLIKRNQIDFIINTPSGTRAHSDGFQIRQAAVARGVPCVTSIPGAHAAIAAIASHDLGAQPIYALQDLHTNVAAIKVKSTNNDQEDHRVVVG